MGQGQSEEGPVRLSHEELAQQLAHSFKSKSFTSLEFLSLTTVFKSLADTSSSVRYLKEDTVARFLAIPDILGASPVVFQLVSCLGSFPFLEDAPVVLELHRVVVVVVLLTERYRKVLRGGERDRCRLLWRSLAVMDRRASEAVEERGEKVGDGESRPAGGAQGYAVDAAGADEGEDGEDDDDLILTAFELLDVRDAVQQGEKTPLHLAIIPTDNLRKLLMLLLLAAPLQPDESLAAHHPRYTGEALEDLRSTAECVLSVFVDAERSPGVRWRTFKAVVPAVCPNLFAGFAGLFEKFLFAQELDFSKKVAPPGSTPGEKPPPPPVPPRIAQPLLRDEADILTDHTLAQLALFLPGSDLFHKVRLLYSGSQAGFSMGSFESKVFNWRAPTILLVRGTRLADKPSGGQEAAFAAALPPRRFPHGGRGGKGGEGEEVTFGVYLREPWKHTFRECFGSSETVLFQLAPTHDVFGASTLNTSYVTFTKAPAPPVLAFGSSHPSPSASHASSASHHGGGAYLPVGPVSLTLDSSFAYGVFNHDHTSRGGAFRTSATRRFDWQERFEVDALEVWGCGGDEEARAQAERWAWEEREAEARRRVNMGTGDAEADRALLEMAGLVGNHRSGGSMT